MQCFTVSVLRSVSSLSFICVVVTCVLFPSLSLSVSSSCSIFLVWFLSVVLFICLSLNLLQSLSCLLFVCLCFSLSLPVYPSFCLYLCKYVCLAVLLFYCPFVCLFLCLSVALSLPTHLSLYLSICLCLFIAMLKKTLNKKHDHYFYFSRFIKYKGFIL